MCTVNGRSYVDVGGLGSKIFLHSDIGGAIASKRSCKRSLTRGQKSNAAVTYIWVGSLLPSSPEHFNGRNSSEPTDLRGIFCE